MPDIQTSGVEAFHDAVIELEQYKNFIGLTNKELYLDSDCLEVIGRMTELIQSDPTVIDFYAGAIKAYNFRRSKPEELDKYKNILISRLEISHCEGGISDKDFKNKTEGLRSGEYVAEEAQLFFRLFRKHIPKDRNTILNQRRKQNVRKKAKSLKQQISDDQNTLTADENVTYKIAVEDPVASEVELPSIRREKLKSSKAKNATNPKPKKISPNNIKPKVVKSKKAESFNIIDLEKSLELFPTDFEELNALCVLISDGSSTWLSVPSIVFDNETYAYAAIRKDKDGSVRVFEWSAFLRETSVIRRRITDNNFIHITEIKIPEVNQKGENIKVRTAAEFIGASVTFEDLEKAAEQLENKEYSEDTASVDVADLVRRCAYEFSTVITKFKKLSEVDAEQDS